MQSGRLALQPAQQGGLALQGFAQRALEIRLEKAQCIATGQTDVQRREVQRRQVLVAPAGRHLSTSLRAVQVDHRQAEVVRGHHLVGMQQEVADVAVAVVDSGAVHGAEHLGDPLDQRTLEARLGRRVAPVAAEVFQADGGRQLLGDDERVLGGRIAATLAEGHGGHGRHAGRGEALDGGPLLGGAEHRQLGAEQVLDDFAPADAAVDLDEVAAPGHFGAQGAAAFQLAVDLPFEALDLGEGVTAGPQALERLGEDQLHRSAPAGANSFACRGSTRRMNSPLRIIFMPALPGSRRRRAAAWNTGRPCRHRPGRWRPSGRVRHRRQASRPACG
ncbi:hypothetical protein D3C78_967700 [compost metagenome]